MGSLVAIEEDEIQEVDPRKEYLAGARMNAYSDLLESVSPKKEERNRQIINFDTFREMMKDSEVGADVHILTDLALSDGVSTQPGLDGEPLDQESSEYKPALEIAQFCYRSLLGLRRPFEETLEAMLVGSLTYGHKLAEKKWKVGEGQDSNKLVLDRIAVKDFSTFDMVVDRFWNFVGITSKVYGGDLGPYEVMPRDKFMHMSFHEEDEDPRGNSHIRPAFMAWQFKQMNWPEYYRFLCSCALPVLIAKTEPKGLNTVQKAVTPSGSVTNPKGVNQGDAMAIALADLKTCGYAVIPNGADVDQIEVASEGEAFSLGFDVSNREIAKAILYQTLATNEAQFGTRAQSETHMEVLDILIWKLRNKIGKIIMADLIKPMIIYNFGPEKIKYAPVISLGDTERKDWATDAVAANTLEGNLTDSQWAFIIKQLGLPPAQPGEKMRKEIAAERMAELMPAPQPGDDKGKPQPSKPPQKKARAHKFISLRV